MVPITRLDSPLRQLAAVGFIAAVAWLAHFSQHRNLGFFSDDHTFSVPPLSWDRSKMSAVSQSLLWSFPEPQGRPLGFWLGYFCPFIGNKLGGLTGMYVVGWAILSLNAVLLYYLMRRTTPGAIPLLSAVFFILFPADTNRPFLCCAHILQPSLTFMLIAAHVYLWRMPGWWAIVYSLVIASLLTYESGMLPILAVPLLIRRWDRQWLVESATHWAATLAVTGYVFVARTMKGEYRVGEANHSPLLTLAQIAGSFFIGPATCVRACELRSWQAWIGVVYNKPYARLLFVPALAAFTGLTWLLTRRSIEANADRPARPFVPFETGRAFQFGAGVLAVSYLLSFTHFPPSLTEGQSTSVHLAAAIGAAVLLAALVELLVVRGQIMVTSVFYVLGYRIGPVVGRRRIGVWVLLLLIGWYPATLLVYGVDEQDAYARLWEQRRLFWTQVLTLCPDMESDTLILCDGMMLPQDSWYLPVVGWGDTLVPAQIFEFPEWYLRRPELQPFHSAAELNPWEKVYPWYDLVHNDGTGHLVWNDPRDRLYGHVAGERLVEGKTILLHVDKAGHVTRQGGKVVVDGVAFQMNPAVAYAKPRFPTRPFYSILTGLPPVTRRPTTYPTEPWNH